MQRLTRRTSLSTAACLTAGAMLPLVGTKTAEARRRGQMPTVEEIRSRSPGLWRLVDLLNAHRRLHHLPGVALSPRLTAVAALHVADLDYYQPHTHRQSLHSWSESDRWKGGIFDAHDVATHRVMWEKPCEVAGYTDYGFEIAVADARSLQHALALWTASPSHADLILNRGIWRSFKWRAMGAVFYRGMATAWFGETVDHR